MQNIIEWPFRNENYRGIPGRQVAGRRARIEGIHAINSSSYRITLDMLRLE